MCSNCWTSLLPFPLTTKCSSASTHRPCVSATGSSAAARVAVCEVPRGVVDHFVSAAPVPADLVFLRELIEAGALRNVIRRAYPLREIAEAHRYAQSGHKVGNVAVVVADPARHAIRVRSLHDAPRSVAIDARAVREPVQLNEHADLALAGGGADHRRAHQPAGRMTEDAERVSELVPEER